MTKKQCWLCSKETTGYVRQTWGYICKACCIAKYEKVIELDLNDKQRRKVMNLKKG